jgi:hypothetical protein
MRKYFHLISITLFLFFVYLIAPPSVDAQVIVGKDQACSMPGFDLIQDRACDASLNLTCVNHKCVETAPPAAGQSIVCSCKNKTPTTNNEVTGGNAIVCPGLPEIYCNSSNDACYDGGTDQLAADKVNLKGNADAYKGKVITGFSCSPKQLIATCTCNPVPNKNGFECALESNPSIKGTATCSSGNACAPSIDGALMNEAANQRGELFDKGPKTNGAGVNMKGVKCIPEGDKAYPTLPPPPSPPCVQWNNGKCDSVGSAFGALSTAPELFVKTIFSILLSLSGGLALLLIMRSGYSMMTSQGKPEQLNSARDQLVAAIVGLVFLILSFVIIQVIGFDILQIPGFGA